MASDCPRCEDGAGPLCSDCVFDLSAEERSEAARRLCRERCDHSVPGGRHFYPCETWFELADAHAAVEEERMAWL